MVAERPRRLSGCRRGSIPACPGRPDSGIHSGPMHRTDLVARWIAQVGEIDLARCPFTPTGRILDALATISDTSIVEGPGFLSAVAHEADRAAVGARRGIAVDGLGDAKRASLVR